MFSNAQVHPLPRLEQTSGECAKRKRWGALQFGLCKHHPVQHLRMVQVGLTCCVFNLSPFCSFLRAADPRIIRERVREREAKIAAKENKVRDARCGRKDADRGGGGHACKTICIHRRGYLL